MQRQHVTLRDSTKARSPQRGAPSVEHGSVDRSPLFSSRGHQNERYRAFDGIVSGMPVSIVSRCSAHVNNRVLCFGTGISSRRPRPFARRNRAMTRKRRTARRRRVIGHPGRRECSLRGASNRRSKRSRTVMPRITRAKGRRRHLSLLRRRSLYSSSTRHTSCKYVKLV